MSPPVFISYARSVSREHAEDLHQVLGGLGGLAFLDTSELEWGEKFPPELLDAMLASRVVVIFASEEYFQRPYCLWELRVALGEFLPAEPGKATAAMLPSIVVALPSQGRTPPELLPLPPGLLQAHWPTAGDVASLEKEVRRRLAENPRTLAERLEATGTSITALRRRLLAEPTLYPPKNLASLRVYPRALPPSLGTSFVGRANDLWRIHDLLFLRRDARGPGVTGAALTGALQGAGGSGKTRLALEYLHRFGPSHYPGGLFWVTADVGPERREEQFHGILRMLKPEVPDLVDFRAMERSAAREMADALEAVAARERILYVVDNVPEPDSDEAPQTLATWCPAVGKVSLLVTSRARLDLGTEGVHALPVSELAPEAAVELLWEGVPQPERLDDSGWCRIAEWVGRLPLALGLLNRTLRAGAPSPEELLARTHEREPAEELEKQMRMLRRLVPLDALRGVAETFSISYARLPEEVQLSARLIAYMGPDPIPRELLAAIGTDVASDETYITLTSRHLVTPVEPTGAVRMFGSMHRLLADYLRGQSQDPRIELRRACHGLLTLMTPSACETPSAWPLLNACLPHAERIFERWMRLGVHPGAEEEPNEVLLGTTLVNFLMEKGVASRARSVGEQVLRRSEQVYGPEHPATLKAVSNLATALYWQGRFEGARSLQERLLEVSLRVLGVEHEGTLTTMNNLAAVLRAQGKLKEAHSLGSQVLDARRRLLGEEHPETLSAMSNLASFLHAQANLKEARALVERALEMRKRLLGDEHPDVLRLMNNLAGILRDQLDFEAARMLDEHVLDARRRVLGEEHPDTLSSFNNLAVTLLALKNLEGARALQERVLEWGLRVLGEEHPDTLRFMNNLASTLMNLDAWEEARELLHRMLEKSRLLLGDEHPDTLTAMNNFAHTLLRVKGRRPEARALQQQVLEGRRRVLGAAHPDTLIAMGILAETLHGDGELQGARTLEEQALEESRRVLGEEHPSTITSMSHLASILEDMGERERARALKERALELTRHLQGKHPQE